ncbi:hypothetical protein GCM10022421_00370 [Oceanisphaera sediminis]|uniref:Uncharacterized protein n=1 Tax=Oceanisphaera sediminis TaxID=981381 RepID=A0ABP7D0A9_9GAMM
MNAERHHAQEGDQQAIPQQDVHQCLQRAIDLPGRQAGKNIALKWVFTFYFSIVAERADWSAESLKQD